MGESLTTLWGEEINYCPECGNKVEETENPFGSGYHYKIQCPVYISKEGDWTKHFSELSSKKMRYKFNPITGERNV